MKDISINEFMEILMVKIQSELEDGVRINKTEILKNNSVRYHGLVLSREDNNISPTIYVDELFKDYLKGVSIEDIAVEILNVYYNHNNKISDISINYENWIQFDNVKDNVFLKLVNYERNKELLLKHPHIRFLDLAITFHIRVEGVTDSQASVRINYELLKRWDITIEELYEVAEKNTKRIYPFVVKPMEDMIKELTGEDCFCNNYDYNETNRENCDIVNKDDMAPEMYVITNSCGINGAIALACEDFINEFVKKYGSAFVILPSSIHEAICIVDVDKEDYWYLSTMVKEVNMTQIMPEEVLSDNIYFYNKDTRCLECYES